MKKISLILVVLILVLLGIGFTAISMIDWNNYKSEVASKISEVTDKKVVFDGDISLSLFPYPYLNAENVRIVDSNGNGQRNLAQIKSLVVKVDFMSLIRGDLEMQRVALVEPRIDFEVMKNEQLNWYSPMSYERREKLLLMDISLESVTIEKGTVVFRDDKRGINALYHKFNAEIIADKIFGPYRIEGSFVKDNKPAGFAVSIGGFSDSSTTDVSFVLTQPEAEASIMFNGIYNVANIGNSLNGDVTFEVKKINEFLSVMSPGAKIDNKYDMPIALTSTMKVNKSKVDLSNMVIKYGKSVGAGKADVIFANEEISSNGEENLNNKVKINTKLEFSSFDFEPVFYTLNNFYNKHKSVNNKLELPKDYELFADIAVTESIYKAGKIKDLKLKVSIDEEEIEVKDLEVTFPGSTYFTAEGFFKPLNNALFYDMYLNVNSTRSNTLLKWLGIKAYNPTNSLYQAASFKGNLNGNFNNINMSKVRINLDKTEFRGNANVDFAKRNYYNISGEINELNLDSYLPKTPAEVMKKSFKDRVLYKFSKLGYLNNFDADINLKTNLLVYGQVPFENIEVDANLKNGDLLLNKFDVPNAASLDFSATGKIKGFGDAPYFEKIKYDAKSKDITNLVKRINFSDYGYLTEKNLMSKGEFSGDLNRFSLKSSSIIGDIKLQNAGIFEKSANNFSYDAVVKVEHNNFLGLLKEFDINYNPKALSLGTFRLGGKFKGDMKTIDIKSLKASVGKDNLDGDINISLLGERPLVKSKIKIDNFQFDRYLSKNPYKVVDGKTKVSEKETNSISAGVVTFIAKPSWGTKEVDYSLFNKFDVKSDIQFGKLIIDNKVFDRFVANVDLTNSVLKLANIKSEYSGAFVLGNLDFTFSGEPTVKGDLKIDNLKVSNGFEKDRIFDFQTDIFNTKFTFDSKITSMEKFIKSLNAKIDFNTDKIVIKGINLQKLSRSFNTLKKSKEVEALISSNISKGSDVFTESFGSVEINRGRAKFVDIFFNSEDIALTLNNTSSIPNWTLDAKLNVEFLKFPNLPKLEIIMKDSMASPIITADYSKIEEYYKSIETAEAKRIQDEINLKKAELRRFTTEKVALVVSHKREVNKLINDMKAEVVGIKDVSILAKSEKVNELYEKIIANIEATEEINRKPEITENLFIKVEDYMLENNRYIDEYTEEVNNVIFSSLRLKARDKMNVVISNMEKATKIIKDYRDTEISKIKDLSEINKEVKFSSNAKFNELHNNLNIYVDDLYSKNEFATVDYDKSQKSRIVEEMKLYISNLVDYAKDISLVTNDINKVTIDIASVMDVVIGSEKTKLAEIVKKKLVEKEVKDSKGSLSVRGKTKKFGLTKSDVLSKINGTNVSNDNISSDDANLENNEEPIMVLDFSKNNKSNQQDKLNVKKSGFVHRF